MQNNFKEVILKINLYRIEKKVDKNKDDITYATLESELKAHNYSLKSKENIEGIKYEVFVNEKDRESIEWLEELINIFRFEDFDPNYGELYKAIIIIKGIKNKIHAIPFGYSYHLIQKLCDFNFALDFAESELTNEGLTIKSSEFLYGNKIKEIVNIKPESIPTTEGGENYKYVSGIPQHTGIFGKKVECGYSIRFSKNISVLQLEGLKEINFLIQEVERAISKKDKLSSFPRVRYFHSEDKINEEYDLKSMEKIKNKEISFDFYISPIDIIGTNFLIYTSEYSFEIYVKNNSSTTKESNDNITEQYIIQYIQKNEEKINSLEDIIIIIKNMDEEVTRKSLKNFLLFIFTDEDNNKIILSSGRWGEVNRSFLDEIERHLNFIQDNNMVLNDPKYVADYSNEDNYVEKIITNNNGLFQLHRKLIKVNGSRYELADLWDKSNNKLIAAKLGKDNQDFIYSFDQVNSAVKCLINYKDYDLIDQLEDYNFKKDEIDLILKSRNYSIILAFEQKTYRKTIVEGDFKLNDLKSLLLKIKICHWSNYMNNMGVEYELIVIPGERT